MSIATSDGEARLLLMKLRQAHGALDATDDVSRRARSFTGALLPAVEWLVETSTLGRYFPVLDEPSCPLAPFFRAEGLYALLSAYVLPENISELLHVQLSELVGVPRSSEGRDGRSPGMDALGPYMPEGRNRHIELRAELARVYAKAEAALGMDETLESLSKQIQEHAELAQDGSGQCAFTLATSDNAINAGPTGGGKSVAGPKRWMGTIANRLALVLTRWPVGRLVALRGWTATQFREMLGEIQRFVEPPVKVSSMDGNALGIKMSPVYGGHFVVVPMASGAMADVMYVERGRRDQLHTVTIYRQLSRGGQLLRERAWSVSVEDVSTARFVMASVVAAYTRGRGGSRAMRNMILAAVAMVAIAAAVAASRPGEPASPVPEAQASSQDPMTAALAATSFNAEGGLPPELMAQILAGAQQAQAGTQNAGGVASDIEHESASMFQSRMHAGGPPQVPEEDVDMNSFGLGRTIAGCDPSLKFKVGAEQ